MVTKTAGDGLSLSMKLGDDAINYQFSQSASSKVGTALAPEKGKAGNSVYIPAKEVLSLFSVILKSREVDKSFGFDDTYYDLVKALRISPSRGKNYAAFANSRKVVSDVIDGKVDYDEETGKWFYRNGKKQKFSIGATSEGVKKIAIMDRLLANGYLDTNSIIFIDEIESALHPEANMQFGEYSEEQVFHLEKSGQYVEKLKPNGIKSCEFILRRDNKLLNAGKEWLIPFQDVFRRELRDEIKIWKVSSFIVINEAAARVKHLVL